MIGKINFQNDSRYNISFGLTPANREAIKALRQRTGNGADIVARFDMKDPDIQPCFDAFSQMVSEDCSNYRGMNAILEKLNVLDVNSENKGGLIGCLSSFLKCWDNMFLSTRTNAVALFDKLGLKHPDAGHISRTATNPLYADTAKQNIEEADKFVKATLKPGECPDKKLLIDIHKIVTKGLDFHANNGVSYPPKDYAGIIEQSKEDKIVLREEKVDLEERLDKFMVWLKNNYNKDDVFHLCAQSYKGLLGISPFYDGNGRAIRAFLDGLLYSRGYRMKEYPANFAEARNMSMKDLRAVFEEHCEKLPERNS